MKLLRLLPLKFWLPLMGALIFTVVLAVMLWLDYQAARSNLVASGMTQLTNEITFLQCWSEVNLNQQPETLTG